MEPIIDDGESDRYQATRETYSRIASEGKKVNGYFYPAGTNRYVPYYWDQVCASLKPRSPDPEELTYAQAVTPEDVKVFPELAEVKQVLLSLCEDGEVYEVKASKVNKVEVEVDYIRSVIQNAVQAGIDLREEVETLEERYVDEKVVELFNQFLAETAS